ncbi:MAG: Co(2+)/Mg(2+) efflux protein ApaG [Alphaproteobacteria bacterium]
MNMLNEYLENDVELYSHTTQDITVSAAPLFVDEASVPEENKFFWAYYIKIENNSSKNIQLVDKSFVIADSLGNTTIAKDLGQPDNQPIVISGDSYEYTGLTPLGTPSGIIVGKIGLIDENGLLFDIDIPAFSLDSPYENIVLN